MKIAVVSMNCCVRCTQSSLATMKAGHEVHLILHPDAFARQFNAHFTSESVYWDQKQLLKAIDNIEPDLIHVHDRPHEIASFIVRKKLGVPVVNDIHDQDSALVMPMGNPMHESYSIQKADGLVFVSDRYREYAETWLGPLPPSVVVPSMACENLMPTEEWPRIGAAVWEGGMYPHEPGDPRCYIDQRGIVKAMVSVGQSCVMYSAPNGWPKNAGPYNNAGARVMSPLPYQPLLQHLTQYDFGWYGQTENAQQIHITLPNKMFDYVAAGLPVFVVNADAAAEFVEKHGVGIAVKRPEEIKLHKDKLEEIRRTMWTRRKEFTREEAIKPMLEMYASLTGKPAYGRTDDETNAHVVRPDHNEQRADGEPGTRCGVTGGLDEHGDNRAPPVRNRNAERSVGVGVGKTCIEFAA